MDNDLKCPVVCELCGYSTLSKAMLNMHHKRRHKTEKWDHQCQYCPFQTYCIQKFESHIDAKHPEHGEKTFLCDHCEESFIFERSLKKHISNVKAKLKFNQKKANEHKKTSDTSQILV